ncbi:2037_t:CDS:2, partial [Rhizophagus irregularis]
NLSLDKLSDKQILIESKSFVNIKTFLGGEELPLTKLISECFDTRKYYIVIDPPSDHITFKKCVNEKKLVVGDKIIYNDNNICLEAGWMFKDGCNIVDILVTKAVNLVVNKSKKKIPYILSTIRLGLCSIVDCL